MLKIPRLFPDDPGQYAVVYQFWTRSPQFPVHHQTFIPILHSIATIRHFQPDIDIYIIDYSDRECKWGPFLDRFKIQVIRQTCALASFRYKKFVVRGELPLADFVLTEHLSRSIDVWNLAHKIPKRYIVYSDCDMMWRQSCLPVTRRVDLFQCRDNNTGLFYFDKQSSKVEDLMELWMSLSCLASRDRRFRARVLSHFGYEGMQDEAVFRYIKVLCRETYKRCVQELDLMENFNPADYSLQNIERLADVRSLHLMGYAFGPSRSFVPWLLREFHPIMVDSFTKRECIEMFEPVLSYGGAYELATVRDGILNQDPEKRKKYVEFGERVGIQLDHTG